MPSKARIKFESNADDVRRLLEIHKDLGGDKKGRRVRLEVLNKSAIVLITAIWEAYCEDLATEALQHIVDHAPDSTVLPPKLKKQIAKELKDDRHELAIWTLADHGWQTVLTERLTDLTQKRNFWWNSPNAKSVIELFSDALGIPNVCERWRWKKMSVNQAKTKLDAYVTLRGAIAHRGQAATGCTRKKVTDYFAHVTRLAAQTGGMVDRHVRSITGLGLWETPPERW
jgi:hypothetical protein